MNNGVNDVNTNNQVGLLPMEGVTLAPPMENALDASTSDKGAVASTSSVPPVSSGAMPTVGAVDAAPSMPTETSETVLDTNTAATTLEEPKVEEVNTPESNGGAEVKKIPEKKKTNFIPFFVVVIAFLVIGLVAMDKMMNQKLTEARYNCTPITASKEEKVLDINSTLVQSLYGKVATSIREDLAQPKFNEEMKLYLAYRQISDNDKYETVCTHFSPTAMEPFVCQVTTYFTPKAFKEEVLILKLKELFGENVSIPLRNVQLGHSCVVGYQYIPSRGDFVEGYCNQQTSTSLSVDKTVTKATSTRNTIIITEQVKYRAKGGGEVPDYLKSGLYHYVFRLDMNYNYVLIDKLYESEY